MLKTSEATRQSASGSSELPNANAEHAQAAAQKAGPRIRGAYRASPAKTAALAVPDTVRTVQSVS